MSFKGKNILVTGGCGSVGSELVSRLAKDAKVIRIFDNYENGLLQMQQKYKNFKNARYLLGDVRDRERLDTAMENIDIVFHTAALKHVWACEYNPFEAVKTNVDGLQNAVDCAMKHNVEKFIFTSSDKAANPSNVMGTTKLVGEKLVTAANFYKGNKRTVFASIRFGNVMGSSGSVIPVFREQVGKGGPVTVTDPKMTRFVITMDQAAGLVLEAAGQAKGGEVFILKMDALNVKDLAEVMVSELSNGKKVSIVNEGTKPGEKMYEELFTEEEATRALEAQHMFVILPQLTELFGVKTNYKELKPAKVQPYTSRDAKLLSKEAIKSLLNRENLL